jgi:hypothetical protein
MKFQRNYKMDVQVGQEGTSNNTVTISYPLTLMFDIQRRIFSTTHSGHFQIFNLAPETRNRMFKDRYQFNKLRNISVYAGYVNDNRLPSIFKGNILQTYSYRQGVNYVTDIEALSGMYGILVNDLSMTVPATEPLTLTFKKLIALLPDLTIGFVSDFSKEQPQRARAMPLVGNAWDAIVQLAQEVNADAYVDGDKVYVLSKKEFITPANSFKLISAETGLLGTPRRTGAQLDVNLIFEPNVFVGQQITLKTIENPNIYNGDYKVIGLKHRGTISEAVDGGVVTTLNLQSDKWTDPIFLNEL